MVMMEVNPRLEAFVQLITVIIIFIFVLLLTYFTTRYVGKYQKTRMAGNNIQIIETMRLSNSKYIQIVQIGSKYFSIAVCKDTVTFLCEVNAEDIILKDDSAQIKNDPFKVILDKLKKDKPND